MVSSLMSAVPLCGRLRGKFQVWTMSRGNLFAASPAPPKKQNLTPNHPARRRVLSSGNQHITEYLKFFCSHDAPGFAVMLNGPWGSGKTHFIKRFIEEYENEFRGASVTYISVFGLNSLADLQTELLLATLPIPQKANSLLRFGGTAAMKLFETKIGVDPSPAIKSIVDQFGQQKTNVIVIDDLERCHIDPSTLLGFLNPLIEHHQKKVIVLTDRSKLDKKHETKREELLATLEKVTGASFTVNPDPLTAEYHAPSIQP